MAATTDVFGTNTTAYFDSTVNAVAETAVFAALEIMREKIATPATAGTVLESVELNVQDVAAIPGKVRRVYKFTLDLTPGTEAVDLPQE